MKRILSERNLVVLLFVIASACFVFAQQDAKKVERMFMSPAGDVSSIVSGIKNTTENVIPEMHSEANTIQAGYR